jgi:ABC-type nickel/cobalt efflux system permease component RcnA
MAGTDAATVTGQRSLLRRVLDSRWVTYFVGIEVFLGAIVFLALQFMAQNPFQGIIVGMAISLGVLIAVVAVVAVLVAGWRTLTE